MTIGWFLKLQGLYLWGDPEEGAGGPDQLENHKVTKPAFSWAIIGLPLKHHLNGVLLAGR